MIHNLTDSDIFICAHNTNILPCTLPVLRHYTSNIIAAYIENHKKTPLTDSECDEFRRHPGSFNDMVRAIYEAGKISAMKA